MSVDIEYQVKRLVNNNQKAKGVISRLKAHEKCVICESISIFKDGSFENDTRLNVYNDNIRAVLCKTCNEFESNVKRAVENDFISYKDMLRMFDEKKVKNVINNVYIHGGIIPMEVG